MNLDDYVHIAVAKEAQDLLRREPGEPVHAFDRRLDKYIHRRMRELAASLIALDAERRCRAAPTVVPDPRDSDPEVA